MHQIAVGALLSPAREVEGLEGDRAAPVEVLENRQDLGTGREVAHGGHVAPGVLNAVDRRVLGGERGGDLVGEPFELGDLGPEDEVAVLGEEGDLLLGVIVEVRPLELALEEGGLEPRDVESKLRRLGLGLGHSEGGAASGGQDATSPKPARATPAGADRSPGCPS